MYNSVTANVCSYNGENGIPVNDDYNSVTGNTCFNNSDDGIHLTSDADENAVSNNVSRLNDYGINISHANADKNIVTGNQLTGNYTGSLQNLGTGTILDNNNI
jgi:parallel beta-helix repeat protein